MIRSRKRSSSSSTFTIIHFSIFLRRSPSSKGKLVQPPQTSTPTYYCDGGSYQNIPLINFLQRRVKNIVLFESCVMPLQPSDKWDPRTEPYTADKVPHISLAFYPQSLIQCTLTS